MREHVRCAAHSNARRYDAKQRIIPRKTPIQVPIGRMRSVVACPSWEACPTYSNLEAPTCAMNGEALFPSDVLREGGVYSPSMITDISDNQRSSWVRYTI
jgi:hypothetical protein